MPSFVDKHSFVIVNSVSGNTEESILMMQEAWNRNAEVIFISSAERLQEICKFWLQAEIMLGCDKCRETYLYKMIVTMRINI